jgi:hypothetical protein
MRKFRHYKLPYRILDSFHMTCWLVSLIALVLHEYEIPLENLDFSPAPLVKPPWWVWGIWIGWTVTLLVIEYLREGYLLGKHNLEPENE